MITAAGDKFINTEEAAELVGLATDMAELVETTHN